jgi:hypothetical protein
MVLTAPCVQLAYHGARYFDPPLGASKPPDPPLVVSHSTLRPPKAIITVRGSYGAVGVARTYKWGSVGYRRWVLLVSRHAGFR